MSKKCQINAVNLSLTKQPGLRRYMQEMYIRASAQCVQANYVTEIVRMGMADHAWQLKIVETAIFRQVNRLNRQHHQGLLGYQGEVTPR